MTDITVNKILQYVIKLLLSKKIVKIRKKKLTRQYVTIDIKFKNEKKMG